MGHRGFDMSGHVKLLLPSVFLWSIESYFSYSSRELLNLPGVTESLFCTATVGKKSMDGETQIRVRCSLLGQR